MRRLVLQSNWSLPYKYDSYILSNPYPYPRDRAAVLTKGIATEPFKQIFFVFAVAIVVIGHHAEGGRHGFHFVFDWKWRWRTFLFVGTTFIVVVGTTEGIVVIFLTTKVFVRAAQFTQFAQGAQGAPCSGSRGRTSSSE